MIRVFRVGMFVVVLFAALACGTKAFAQGTASTVGAAPPECTSTAAANNADNNGTFTVTCTNLRARLRSDSSSSAGPPPPSALRSSSALVADADRTQLEAELSQPSGVPLAAVPLDGSSPRDASTLRHRGRSETWAHW